MGFHRPGEPGRAQDFGWKKARYFPSCLDLISRGHTRSRKDSGPRTQARPTWPYLSVRDVTLRCDGVGNINRHWVGFHPTLPQESRKGGAPETHELLHSYTEK